MTVVGVPTGAGQIGAAGPPIFSGAAPTDPSGQHLGSVPAPGAPPSGFRDPEKPAAPRPSSVSARVPKILVSGWSAINIQPWRECLGLPDARDELKARIRGNVRRNAANYAVACYLVLLLASITNWRSVVCMLVITPLWFLFLQKRDDPIWETCRCGPYKMGRTVQWFVLFLFMSLVPLIFVGWSILQWTLGLLAFVLYHAATRPLPTVPEEGEKGQADLESGPAAVQGPGVPDTHTATIVGM